MTVVSANDTVHPFTSVLHWTKHTFYINQICWGDGEETLQDSEIDKYYKANIFASAAIMLKLSETSIKVDDASRWD